MHLISIKPYPGIAYYTSDKKDFRKTQKKLFGISEEVGKHLGGRFYGEQVNGYWTYLIYATSNATIAHEVSHMILHMFDRIGINPHEGNGEPFRYLLEQVIKDIEVINGHQS